MALYPKSKIPVELGNGATTLDRQCEKRIPVRSPHATNIIVIHGVNDVGVGYGNVESGLCEGLNERLNRNDISPACFRDYTEADRKSIDPDPDAKYFKRRINPATHSPVIPFYWGYRAAMGTTRVLNEQIVDATGNRLDKDYSKEGGPFANATTNLVDFWNTGAPHSFGVFDKLKGDPLRPVVGGPGRIYMVLAAKRLAMLITMIRDYDENDTVAIVAHSQGCMISLLAQAFLIDGKNRPADTLILTHPPYSLEETFAEDVAAISSQAFTNFSSIGGGHDECMIGQYDKFKGQQTLKARIETLANIVNGVHKNKNSLPTLQEFKTKEVGVTGARWEPDRDNRGKVYLYFCPRT